MSKLSQYISFINAKAAPTRDDMTFYYTSIEKTPELMIIRRKYQSELKKQVKFEKNEIDILNVELQSEHEK